MMTGQIIDIDGLVPILRERGSSLRSITAIAGAPGAGKSTVADMLAEKLNAADPGSAAVLPMDGFHFDDMVLVSRGWRSRKGAPHTFDVAGLVHMLARLRANIEPEIAVPVFDREIEIARAGARIIPNTVRHLIVEGNYLLLAVEPWSELATYLDTTIFLNVPMAVLRRRLEARWKNLQPEEFALKLDANDLPNAELVTGHSRESEFVLPNFPTRSVS